MNYLGHFVFNHELCGLAREPYFAMGAALPDLWPRYSRTRRIRWNRVREFDAQSVCAGHLRDGLLNHIDTDRRFHSLPCFLRWHAALRKRLAADNVSGTVADFLAHVALELALDHRLICENPARGEDFYDLLAQCNTAAVERVMGEIRGAHVLGLAREIDAFIARRFLPRFRDPEVLVTVLRYIGGLTRVPMPASSTFLSAVSGALDLLEPGFVWSDMPGSGQARR